MVNNKFSCQLKILTNLDAWFLQKQEITTLYTEQQIAYTKDKYS